MNYLQPNHLDDFLLQIQKTIANETKNDQVTLNYFFSIATCLTPDFFIN